MGVGGAGGMAHYCQCWAFGQYITLFLLLSAGLKTHKPHTCSYLQGVKEQKGEGVLSHSMHTRFWCIGALDTVGDGCDCSIGARSQLVEG